MPLSLSRREMLSLTTRTAAAITAAEFFANATVAVASSNEDRRYRDAFQRLDKFVEQYMKEMYAPGMTLGVATRDGIARVVSYGLSDTKLQQKVTPEQLFHIGSITKSFCAIVCLQLREEGKLDLDRPVTEYAPWFRVKSKYKPITAHHLLTHSAGLPGNPPTFLPDPEAAHETAYAPGEGFHYCNMAFDVLGNIIRSLDGRPWREAVRERILKPVGMNATEPIITLANRDRAALSYSIYRDDVPFAREGRMGESGPLIIDRASGSIASTPHDMALYMQALLNRGKLPNGKRILSEESFALMSKAHIKAEEFGPTASYGYGIVVDSMDGHTILRHTGGMLSFASAMQLDMDEGVGAWASINAMQGYRPNPVAVFTLKSLRAANAKSALPEMPKPQPWYRVPNAADYAGVFTAADGSKRVFLAENDRLFLLDGSHRIWMEQKGGDIFLAYDAELSGQLFVFGRAESRPGEKTAPPVVEVGHGPHWYVGDKYTGPREAAYPKEWDAFTGHYRSDNPWEGSIHILVRKGKLLADGVVPLEPMPDGRFRLQDEPNSPEWVRFLHPANGMTMLMSLAGANFWRVQD